MAREILYLLRRPMARGHFNVILSLLIFFKYGASIWLLIVRPGIQTHLILIDIKIEVGLKNG